jgi:universal stress protein A
MNSYKQILVALDLSDDSQRVCLKALQIAGDNKVSLFIVHVVEFVYQVSVAYEPMFYPAFEDLSKNEEELIKLSKKKMASLLENQEIKALSAKGTIEIDSDVISGIPKSEILRLAEEKHIDLIVCGSHGRSGFELLLGSTANAILHHAPCDVLAVRTQKS